MEHYVVRIVNGNGEPGPEGAAVRIGDAEYTPEEFFRDYESALGYAPVRNEGELRDFRVDP